LVRLACKACDILNGVKLILPRWRVLYIDLVLTARLSYFWISEWNNQAAIAQKCNLLSQNSDL